MVTSEERMKILTMINEGKITAEEGSKLLSVLTRGSEKPKKRPSDLLPVNGFVYGLRICLQGKLK